MAYYRVITPAGHLAPGTVVTDERAGAHEGQSALFSLLPQTARALCQSGALEPIPDPEPGPAIQEEPGWSDKDKEAQHSVARPARDSRRRRD